MFAKALSKDLFAEINQELIDTGLTPEELLKVYEENRDLTCTYDLKAPRLVLPLTRKLEELKIS